MVMSGSGERVVFVYGRPGDECLASGGTIARLRADGAQVMVLFATPTTDAPAAGGAAELAGAQSAMDELDVSDWRLLAADTAPAAAADAIRQAVRDMRATALVLGAMEDALSEAAVRAGRDSGIPVFLARRVTASGAQRVTAIDVDDHVEQKLRALAAYPGRWSVKDGALALADGSLMAVTGSETYVRLESPHPARDEAPPTPLARLGGGIAALAVGMAFGVLGTIGHQATVLLGGVALPVGLVLALAGAAGLLVGLRLVLGDRLVVLFCALGMLGTIFVLSLRSTGGSVLIPEGLPGLLWTVVPTLVAAVALGWPKLPARR
jgi:LmbE family N-acetylglucosaminyl deacetylase